MTSLNLTPWFNDCNSIYCSSIHLPSHHLQHAVRRTLHVQQHQGDPGWTTSQHLAMSLVNFPDLQYQNINWPMSSRNCARSGGGKWPKRCTMYKWLIYVGSSLNYIVDEPDVTIDDPHSVLKNYEDNETTSGNCALVIFFSLFFFLVVADQTTADIHLLQRQFCSNCGWSVINLSSIEHQTLYKY